MSSARAKDIFTYVVKILWTNIFSLNSFVFRKSGIILDNWLIDNRKHDGQKVTPSDESLNARSPATNHLTLLPTRSLPKEQKPTSTLIISIRPQVNNPVNASSPNTKDTTSINNGIWKLKAHGPSQGSPSRGEEKEATQEETRHGPIVFSQCGLSYFHAISFYQQFYGHDF